MPALVDEPCVGSGFAGGNAVRPTVRVVEFWAQRVQTTVESRPGWVVVDDRCESIDDVVWVLQHGRGRSDGIARAGVAAEHQRWRFAVMVRNDRQGP